ncbi:PREDICTED: DNA dC-_dU-editing enzyme APOBEC-3B-like [Elephantulus edwardii]|uniref:DNA dC->dU-editing enzyme APOBEC-3B-like n=1 Tax=Elephantulus edwardii TaxID=28737 RepID=UPI0003F0D9C8|nr:PREDICTED: DNA dC->dU-editing enzyme APOBEC-3B-like [Elephantulus edwardii]
MDKNTFIFNFKNGKSAHRRQKTYLCYKVQLLNNNSRVWLNIEGFLHNELRRHTELCFLDQIPSWSLHRATDCRITWFLSWSPCPNCAREVAAFLENNSHVHLRIFASRIYNRLEGYEQGLRSLWDAGAQLFIMKHRGVPANEECWDPLDLSQGPGVTGA